MERYERCWSNFHNTYNREMQDVANERGETMSRPKCVVDYNDQMGGVDKIDQHLAPYSTSRKREENTKIFFHLLDLAL
ncbi:hypothetical protein TNCV_1984531 [Trichonephila clavipes]|nr:hypothetical protein TNCV_1984531 [Trichonephila clavipes]